jgi:hypothetical protein
MSLFNNLTTDGLEEAQDRLGGFSRLESGAYTGKIKAAYAGVAANSKAQSITVILAHGKDGKEEYRETLWITNKNGENFFVNKGGDGKKSPLPGFTIINDLCLVTTNKPLAEQPTEEKVMNIYDPDAKKELPKAVQMLVDLLDTEVTFGIIKQTVNKQEKDSAGNYQDTAETRDENFTDKIFHYPSNLTVNEALNKITTATFYGAWVEKNKGVTRDRTNKDLAKNGGKAGRPGMPPQAATAGGKTSSLFGAR